MGEALYEVVDSIGLVGFAFFTSLEWMNIIRRIRIQWEQRGSVQWLVGKNPCMENYKIENGNTVSTGTYAKQASVQTRTVS